MYYAFAQTKHAVTKDPQQSARTLHARKIAKARESLQTLVKSVPSSKACESVIAQNAALKPNHKPRKCWERNLWMKSPLNKFSIGFEQRKWDLQPVPCIYSDSVCGMGCFGWWLCCTWEAWRLGMTRCFFRLKAASGGRLVMSCYVSAQLRCLGLAAWLDSGQWLDEEGWHLTQNNSIELLELVETHMQNTSKSPSNNVRFLWTRQVRSYIQSYE